MREGNAVSGRRTGGSVLMTRRSLVAAMREWCQCLVCLKMFDQETKCSCRREESQVKFRRERLSKYVLHASPDELRRVVGPSWSEKFLYPSRNTEESRESALITLHPEARVPKEEQNEAPPATEELSLPEPVSALKTVGVRGNFAVSGHSLRKTGGHTVFPLTVTSGLPERIPETALTESKQSQGNHLLWETAPNAPLTPYSTPRKRYRERANKLNTQRLSKPFKKPTTAVRKFPPRRGISSLENQAMVTSAGVIVDN